MSGELVPVGQEHGHGSGLTIATANGLEHAYRVAKALAQSGMFKDAQQANQAFAKIVAGIELGIGPVAAMTQFHVIDGKLAPGATLMAALIRRSGRYRFRVLEATGQACRIEFYSREGGGEWELDGVAAFTLDDAKQAGLLNKGNWRGYPHDMLFARALSQGVRRFCADILGGSSAYVPDELGDDGPVERMSVVLADDAVAADAGGGDEIIDDAAGQEVAAVRDDGEDADGVTGVDGGVAPPNLLDDAA